MDEVSVYISSLKIKGFRRIFEAEFKFGKTSFLIGTNNTGKSSVLKAIEYLIDSNQKLILPEDEFYSTAIQNGIERVAEQVVLECEFRDVPEAYASLKGFKGRIFKNQSDNSNYITLKKTFGHKEPVLTEILSKKRVLKKEIKKVQDLLDFGVSIEEVEAELGIKDPLKNITKAMKIDNFDEIFELQNEDEWDINPGGFLGVFASKLPKYIEIPALHSYDQLTGKKADDALNQIMTALFQEIREGSENFKKANESLNALALELNPTDSSKEFGKLLGELNNGFDGVFPGAKLNISVDLSNPDESIKPTFNVGASSNIPTKISRQGTGLSRSAVFNLLKFREQWLERRASAKPGHIPRSLIIGFEEPEIYLHPNAARLIREFIYDLCEYGSVQIIASTHSPVMMDLSREKTSQVINHLYLNNLKNKDIELSVVQCNILNHSASFKSLQEDDRAYMRMLLRIDDSVCKALFSKEAIIFEGDSEQIVFHETILRLDKERKTKIIDTKSLINARGKATILPLVKYLNAMNIPYKVMHDSDKGKSGAEVINKSIKELAGENRVVVLEDCLETVLGYKPPDRDKPYMAFKYASAWPKSYEDIPKNWKAVFSKLMFE